MDTVLLSPDLSNGTLNVTNVCLTAHVTNTLSNPVEGVLVNFHVSGISSELGFGYTDAAGNTQYCYSRTGTTTGTDHIYAEVSGKTSDTSLVIWSSPVVCVSES